MIRDTGIGMTRQELLDALGTIANSGTAKFAAALKESQESHDANLIGQFGVGFYSAFLVADRVRVQTKSHKEGEQWVWEGKSGSTTYSVEPDTSGEDLVRGTQITLFVREESHDVCSHLKLQELIRQYSNFIEFPISLWASKSVSRQVEDAEATKKAQEEADKALGEGEEPKPVDPVMKTEYDTVFDWATQNDTKPLWLRSPKEVEEEEYNAFFKSTFKEFLDPVAHNHFNVEGTIEFSGMIFIPGTAGFDQSGEMMQSRNIKLYVKRVFISDEFDDSLMPRYLSFVKGVVDSSDLPLNVSREILQESRVTRIVRKQLVKRTLDTLKQLAGREDQTSWNTFWEAFGRNLKLGVIEDAANREALSKLLRFPTSHGEEQTSLADYVSRMKEGQQGIFFLPAATKDAAEVFPAPGVGGARCERLAVGTALDLARGRGQPRGNEGGFTPVEAPDVGLGHDLPAEGLRIEAQRRACAALSEPLEGRGAFGLGWCFRVAGVRSVEILQLPWHRAAQVGRGVAVVVRPRAGEGESHNVHAPNLLRRRGLGRVQHVAAPRPEVDDGQIGQSQVLPQLCEQP